jgi:hypothetical protein
MWNDEQREGTSVWAHRRRRGRKAAVCGLALVMVALGALEPRAALACGGLFCDGPPPNPFSPLPVAQNGENVVFAIDKDPAGGATRLTAHIQILYTGDAAKFSWIVPVDAAPTLGVGTDQLFTSLLGATQPRFQATYATEGQCLPEPRCTACQNKGPAGNGSASGSADAGTTAVPGDAVTVSFQGAVGPYDAAVIQSTDPTALETWLTSNGYVVDDTARAIIAAYVHENKFFVAVKLMNGKDTKSIQPVVLKFIGSEPCIPLRLTAIAANPDMPVRIWVLGNGRVVPKTFFEVKVDEARIDWASGGSNYASLSKSLLSQAADEAGGTAFVTEYAGPSSIAANQLWSPARFNLTALEAAQTPPVYVQALVNLGLASNVQVLPLLDMYIPMPDELKAMGLSDAQFYGNIASYWSQYKFPAFDLKALTAAIKAQVIAPLQAAQEMLDGHPYMTRMNTFISPEEMSKDALFFESSGLGDVPQVHTATFRTMCGDQKFMACNAPVRLELADGRMAWVRNGSTAANCQYQAYDLSGLQKLPAAEKVWQRDVSGEGTVIMDNTAQIEAGLAVNNSAFPAAQNMFPMPTRGGGAATTTASGGGCACGVGGATAGGAVGLGAAAAALVLARRRRSRRAAS